MDRADPQPLPARGDPRFLGWLMESMRSGLVAIDRSGRVAAVNAGARRMLGVGAEAVGRPCREVFEAEPTVVRLLEGALDGRERPSRAELTLRAAPTDALRPDPDPRTIGFTLDAVRDPDGDVAGAVLLFRDLTPFERQDEQERLRDRLAALGQMAAGLAHELRNPLAGMEVLTGLLRRRLSAHPEELALLGELASELRTLSRTVTESLEFVRPVRIDRKAVDPVELVEESLALARSRVPFSGTIDRAYEEDLPWLDADPEQLRAVVTNLVVNAFESMAGFERPDGHRLVLGLSRVVVPRLPWSVDAETRALAPVSVEELEIVVADTGPGVGEGLRERVFHPFFTTKERGSGVGLAHAQKVAASHGGALELDHSRGVGAVFRLRIPIREDAS